MLKQVYCSYLETKYKYMWAFSNIPNFLILISSFSYTYIVIASPLFDILFRQRRTLTNHSAQKSRL